MTKQARYRQVRFDERGWETERYRMAKLSRYEDAAVNGIFSVDVSSNG